MLKGLVKLANHLDSKGLRKEADLLDEVIIKLSEDDDTVYPLGHSDSISDIGGPDSNFPKDSDEESEFEDLYNAAFEDFKALADKHGLFHSDMIEIIVSKSNEGTSLMGYLKQYLPDSGEVTDEFLKEMSRKKKPQYSVDPRRLYL